VSEGEQTGAEDREPDPHEKKSAEQQREGDAAHPVRAST